MMTTPTVNQAEFRGILIRAVVLPLLLTAALAGVFFWQINRLLAAARWVEHTDEVIARANEAQKLLIDQETGLRGFLLTGNQDFLEPYDRSSTEAPRSLDSLARLVADNPEQVGRLGEIRSAHELWMNYSRDSLALRTSGGDYLARVKSGEGKRLMDEMRAEFTTFIRTEEALRDERTREARRTTYFAVGTGVVLALLLGLILAVFTRRQMVAVSRSYDRALAAEQEQRELLGVTLSSIGDAVIATDSEGRVTFMNAVAESLTRWTKEEAAGRLLPEVFRIINESSRQTVESPAERALREGTVVGLANHTLLVARDGNEVPIDDSGAPIKDTGGKTVGVVLVFRDITERRRAEVEKYRLAAIVESSDDAIISKDFGGTITSWNKGAERVFGYAPGEAVGRNVSILFPPDLLGEESEIIQRVRRGEGIGNYETVRLRKDGTRVPVSLTISPVRNAEGEVVGVSKVARDISERKQAEEERARLREELIRAQAARLEELSTPLIPLSRETVIMPLIGSIDAERAARVLDAVSKGIVSHRARVAIIDITGVPEVDTHVAGALVRAAQAVRLLGAEVVLTGIRPRVARALVGLGVKLEGLVTRKDLQGGVAYALEHLRGADAAIRGEMGGSAPSDRR